MTTRHSGTPAIPTLRWHWSLANEQSSIALHKRRLGDALRVTLEDERVATCELSVAVVTDARIHEINRQFLNHDFPTDVITFELSPPTRVAGIRRRPAGMPVRRGAALQIEGEIVVSAETARRCSPEFCWTPHQELMLYLVHGVLHLCGYDDLDSREERLMRRRESEILAKLGLQPRTAPRK
jgi:probable rRNA maturation factor